MGDPAGAITTLKDVLARVNASAPNDATRDVIIEAGFALVHLLKRTGQLDEAVARLDDIARLAPGRAREAHLQIADIALARHDVTRALSHATAAAARCESARRWRASANCRRALARTSRRSRPTGPPRPRHESGGDARARAAPHSPRRRAGGGGCAEPAAARVARRRRHHGGGPSGDGARQPARAIARARNGAGGRACGRPGHAGTPPVLAALLKRLLPPMYRDATRG